MKKILLTGLLASQIATSSAGISDCPKSTVTAIPAATTVIFYRTVKRSNVIYVPVMNLTADKLTSAYTSQMPKRLTLYELPSNKPIQVRFSQIHDDVDYDLCRSIGIGIAKKTRASNNKINLFATKPIAAEFNFTPNKKLQDQFTATILNPCVSDPTKINPKNSDTDGVVLCDADRLIAVSHFFGKTQFWRTKQYRYDIGFAVNSADDQSAKPLEIMEDCTHCKD